MKNRIKGRRKIISALIMLLTLLTLTQQAFASAWVGQGTGATGAGVASDEATVYYGHYPVLWRVTLYVSGNADGKIKETDQIETDTLNWVGESIYYSPNLYQVKKNFDYAYIQVGSSAYERVKGLNRFNELAAGSTTDDDGNVVNSTYCPLMAPLTSNEGKSPIPFITYTYPSDRRVNLIPSGFDLFNYRDEGDFKTDTDAKLKGSEAGDWTTKIIKHMLDAGASDFWSKISSAIHQNVKNQMSQGAGGGKLTTEEFYRYLLPAKDGKMNPDCLVDYALVVEPMVMYNFKRDIRWWIAYGYQDRLKDDTTYENHNFALDAYYLSIMNYNYSSHFRGDLGTFYGTTAARCHDAYKPDGQSHQGVICSSVEGTGSWADIDKSIYAIRGGICLYTITRDTGIAVFFSKNSAKRA